MENEIKRKTKNGYIYIATSKNYSLNNIFKISKTKDLCLRNSKNTKEEDRLYYCYYEGVYDMNILEEIIYEILDMFRYKNKLFQLQYETLLKFVKNIIRNHNKGFDKFNSFIFNNLEEIYKADPIIPEEIKINEIL